MLGQNVTVLGPGNRYVIWVQGCKRRCEGCIAPEAQPLDGGYECKVEELAETVLKQKDIDGLTISGGEPFLQCKELADMLDIVEAKEDLGVIVYTGNIYEDLLEDAKKDKEIARFLSHIDLLIDGSYIKALDDNKSLRGSSNQRVIPLTKRYEKEAKTLYGQPGRSVEVRIEGSSIRSIGVPGDDFKSMNASAEFKKFIKNKKEK
jgi:anaerobic ribonucleoside-triphosphate reductase activating protein